VATTEKFQYKMLLSTSGHTTFVHYKLPPLNLSFVCWTWTLICSWWTNFLCYYTVALSVSQTNTSLSAWSLHMRRNSGMLWTRLVTP